MGLNAGGAKVPLSLNNIRWNTGNLLFPGKIPEKTSRFSRITVNYAVVEGGPDIRKVNGIPHIIQ